MKKSILVLTLLLVLCIAFAACTDDDKYLSGGVWLSYDSIELEVGKPLL